MVGGAAHAQSVPADLVLQAEARYEVGDYRAAIRWLHGIPGMLGPVPRLTPLYPWTRARVFFDLGCCYLAAGDSTLAEEVFQQAFFLDPKLERGHFKNADPGRFWEELLRQQENARLLATTRSRALIRSLVLPGWGQVYRGHKKRGFVILGTALAAAGVWGLEYRSFRSAQMHYREAGKVDVLSGIRYRNEDGSEFTEFEARYRAVELGAHRANRMLTVAAAIWLLGMTDCIVLGPSQVAFQVSF